MLLSPVQLGAMQMKNRFFLPPHGDRLPAPRQLRYLEERLRHGVGLIICSQPAAVATWSFSAGPRSRLPEGYIGDDDVRLPDPASDEGIAFFDRLLLPQMRQQAELAHRYEAACFAQLTHMGSYAVLNNWQVGLSPSGLADEMLGEPTHALTNDEIAELVAAFGHAASRVQRAGMDGVEISACNGLLLNAFLSPLTNTRQDQYGGSLENRTRFVTETLAEVRRRVGPDLIVGVRIPGDELIPGGLTAEDMVAVAALLRPYVSYLSVGASSESGRKFGLTVPTVMSGEFPEGVFATAAARIRAAVDVPVLLAGGIRDPHIAERILVSGQADMVGAVRAQIADPAWLAKVSSGDIAGIRKCVGDNEGCRTRTQFRTKGTGTSIGCTVNAAVGREEEMEILPAAAPRSVLIVGGGPAGLEAARVAALRGHRVILCEQSARLGGQVPVAALAPGSSELIHAVSDLAVQVERLNVDVRLSTGLDVAGCEKYQTDVIIVATGSRLAADAVPGLDAERILTASEVLQGIRLPGQRVCVVAGLHGHRLPAAIAEWLTDRGHLVTVITERMFLGENQDPAANHHSLARLFERGVHIEPLTGLARASAADLIVFNALTRREHVLGEFDSVVYAAGATPYDEILRALRLSRRRGSVIPIGDCLAPRRIAHAVMDAYRAALTI
jgi:2,4-dienoyl-CoA reductase-like NADH-dependent reductase (Old Yellow Enzyme family)/thioredoxin reductase